MDSKEIQKKEICITNNCCVSFPKREDVSGNLLIIGNFKNICGEVVWNSPIDSCLMMENWDSTQENNVSVIVDALKSILKNNSIIGIIASTETIDYFKKLVYTILDWNFGFERELTIKEKKKILNKNIRTVNIDELYEVEYKMCESDRFTNGRKKIDQIVQNKIFKKAEIMKFDTIIQNPPYNGSLHLDFFEKGVDLLSENGKMVIIEPATWLINVRKNGKAKLYDSVKEKTKGHIKSVVIENLNKEFGTGLYVPFATTTIDMSKTFDGIEFTCFGEKGFVKSIYDCNLIGDYATIWSVIEKCKKFGDMMKSHITKENMGDGMWYAKYGELTPVCGCSYVGRTSKGVKYDSNSMWLDTINGSFTCGYITTAYHTYNNEISENPLCGYDSGKNLTNKIADNIYGTKEELENWKHFIFNNQLPLFLNIVLTIDQHNNSKEFLPWVVGKQYTDEEINDMFGFTDNEIKLINKTIEKYERNSPWFKRYMCGKDSVSDEEVNNFMEQLNKKYE